MMYSNSLFLLKPALTLSCPLTSFTTLVFCRWVCFCSAFFARTTNIKTIYTHTCDSDPR